jgi:glycosyltransferase involved in cell wall biosynthesis
VKAVIAEVEPFPARPLLVGPLPPPVGGVATMVARLAADPAVAGRFKFLDVAKRDKGFVRLHVIRPLRQLFELNRHLMRKPGAVFAFSSAYHSFWEKCLWLLLARIHRTPMLVMMVDGNFIDFHAKLPRWRKRLARAALERFHTVIVLTEYWLQYYSRIAPRAHLAIVPNGVDCEKFIPAPRADSTRVVVLFVGWLLPEKGVFDLVDAVRRLDGAGSRFVVRLVGPYHGYEQALRDRVRDASLGDAIEIVGPVVSRAEIVAEYQRADIFTLPSWAEGLPVSVLEAMACELPIVATQVGGVPDVVSADCGELVPPKQPARLAEALNRFIDDSALRRTAGRAARERVRKSFSSADFGPEICRLVEQAAR